MSRNAFVEVSILPVDASAVWLGQAVLMVLGRRITSEVIISCCEIERIPIVFAIVGGVRMLVSRGIR